MVIAMDLKRRAKLLRELAELPCISEEVKRRSEFLRRLAGIVRWRVMKNETCGIRGNCP